MAGSERVAVVTGASSGIGKETAKALAAQGWHVIGIGRNAERAVAAEAEIRTASRDGAVHMIRADLALMAQAARAAREIAALTDRIHVLVNNAGGMAKCQVITAEGYEENGSSQSSVGDFGGYFSQIGGSMHVRTLSLR